MQDSDLTLAATLAGELNVLATDARLPRLISAASDACRSFLSRKRFHYGAAITELVAAYGRPRLILDVTPVVSVASVAYSDGSVVPSTDYVIDEPDAGLLLRQAGFAYTGNVRPGILQTDRDAGSEKRSLTVVYAGGWVTPAQAAAVGGPARTLPYDIEQAALLVATSMYRQGGADPRIQSESLGDYSVTYWGAGSGLPEQAASLLTPYRRAH